MALDGNTVYSNFIIGNEIEDQFKSHLDLERFCTIDNSLEGVAGMRKLIHKYIATEGTEDLGVGEGNTKAITVSFGEEEYVIKLAQNRFIYNDEHAMTDPMLVPTGTKHMATDMFNHENDDILAEFNKATMIVPVSGFGFNAFVDAQSMLNLENLEGTEIFALVCPTDVAGIRKSLKDDLKYVESFSRNGYVGTCGGVNLYTCKIVAKGTVVLATKEAVTLFNKKGTEVEQKREPNTRENEIYARKYYVPAMTNETKAVKIFIGVASKTADSDVDTSKTYYVASGLGYLKVANPVKADIGNYYEIA